MFGFHGDKSKILGHIIANTPVTFDKNGTTLNFSSVVPMGKTRTSTVGRCCGPSGSATTRRIRSSGRKATHLAMKTEATGRAGKRLATSAIGKSCRKRSGWQKRGSVTSASQRPRTNQGS